MVVLYFLTTFDGLPYEFLTAKLDAYGFDKSSLKLIHSYLSNRKERVKLNDEYRSWSKKLFRNPQASGPLLLNTFMCDRFTFVRTLILHIMHTTLHRILRIKVPNLLSVIWSNHQQFILNGLTISTRN